MSNDLLAVDVRFVGNGYESPKTYTYVKPPYFIGIPNKNDYILTSTGFPTSTRPGSKNHTDALLQNIGVARIVRDPYWLPASSDKRFYIMAFSNASLEKAFDESLKYSQHIAKAAEIRRRLDELLVAPETQLLRYEQLAMHNKEAAQLLAELRRLG